MSARKLPDRALSRREALGILGAVSVTALMGGGHDSGAAAATTTPTHSPTGTATPRPLATATSTTAASATATAAPTETATLPATPTASSTPAATMTPQSLSCVAAPALTEGPFFVDEGLNRSDLTAGTAEPFVVNGLPLRLKLAVYRISGNSCTPLSGAQVDVWHASAEGVYSDEASGSIQSKNTLGETYLRGYQVTDDSGAVEFLTIYPGWSISRTIHIHFKVRVFTLSGQQAFEFTSQLFMADALNDVVLAAAPYNTRGTRRVRNTNDSIYSGQLELVMQPVEVGYVGTFTIGLQTS
jgi:protocatechuate 3,4-dioxygenase beta subunit